MHVRGHVDNQKNNFPAGSNPAHLPLADGCVNKLEAFGEAVAFPLLFHPPAICPIVCWGCNCNSGDGLTSNPSASGYVACQEVQKIRCLLARTLALTSLADSCVNEFKALGEVAHQISAGGVLNLQEKTEEPRIKKVGRKWEPLAYV